MNFYNGFSPRQRNAALKWLKLEYAAGRRSRPAVCDVCAQFEGVIDAHSEDYREPFGDHTGAFGLCFTCHMMLHVRFRSPAAWDRYRAAIREGCTFEPSYGRDFGRFRALFLGPMILAKSLPRAAPPERLIFDEIDALGAASPTATLTAYVTRAATPRLRVRDTTHDCRRARRSSSP